MTKKEKIALAVVLLLVIINLAVGVLIMVKIAGNLGAAAKLKA